MTGLLVRASSATLVATLLCLFAQGVSPAFGDGPYAALKCHPQSRSASEVVEAVKGAYTTRDRCLAPDARLEIANHGFTAAGQNGSWTVTAPPGSYIAGARLSANLRRDNHHRAQIVATDVPGRSTVVVNGSDKGTGFETVEWGGRRDRSLSITLICSRVSGCPGSDVAHAYVRDIELRLVDEAEPRLFDVEGSLLAGGWIRGTQSVAARATDLGSGLASLVAYVNGAEAARAPVVCGGVLAPATASVLAPCPTAPGAAVIGELLDTGSPPFTQGRNALAICATAFAAAGPSCEWREIAVDNVAPVLAFANARDPEEPERIEAIAVERDSGIAFAEIAWRRVGELAWTPLRTTVDRDSVTARIDSGAHPAGQYEFRAEVRDGAGNRAVSAAREDGSAMVLAFPLREPVLLTAGLGSAGSAARRTVRYGGGGVVAGRLLNAGGAPIAGASILVEERFAPGAVTERRVRTAVTDVGGRWSAPLSPGPSRTVGATYQGSARYRPTAVDAGELRVRGAVSFRTSRSRIREGRRVVFRGRVGHNGARMPLGGKLVELQVRESRGRWNTVRHALHTDDDGRYRLAYRFGRFYRSNAVFRFRVKVAREAGWPYLAPVRSRPRSVTVIAR